MAMVPHERSLVERLQGRPFVLLGVSADPSRDVLKRAQEKNKISWRSWWDRPPSRIAAKFEVRGYPSLFLIDRDGIIRRVYVGRPRDANLERDVLQLVGEAEEDAGRKRAEQSRTRQASDL